jgi:hypothetical protein
MNYIDFEKALSPARLNRYLIACNGNKLKALELYQLNIKLSQDFYAILSLFEVALRNSIDEHYKTHFNDNEWLKNQCLNTGFLNSPAFAIGRYKSRKKVDTAIRDLGVRYTHDKVVASISFGFWINLFAPMQFRLAGQNLHHIFSARPTGTKPRVLFNSLSLILDFRNRVAHHEPLCFNHLHQKNTAYALKHYNIIVEKTNWLGFASQDFFDGLDNVQSIITQIDLL